MKLRYMIGIIALKVEMVRWIYDIIVDQRLILENYLVPFQTTTETLLRV